MKKITVLFLLISVFSFGQKIKTKIYTDSLISFEYSKKWKPYHSFDSDEVVTIAPLKQLKKIYKKSFKGLSKTQRDYASYVSTNIYATKEFKSLDDFVQKRLLQLKKTAVNNLSSKEIDSPYKNTFAIAYKHNHLGFTTQALELNFRKGAFLYSIYYIAPVDFYEEYYPEFSIILKSFKVLI